MGPGPTSPGAAAATSDEALIAASRGGDRAAFGVLVERYLGLVCAVSYSATGNRALSEDVAQDAFVAAWAQLPTLREPARWRAWLCGIARNLARKARARALREPASDALPEAAPAWALPAVGPLERLTAAEEQRLVWDALASVPEAYREVLVLYYQQERSIAEVAALLGIREDAAMQRLSRGRKHLAGQLQASVEHALEGARPSRRLATRIAAALPPVAWLAPAKASAASAGAGSRGSLSTSTPSTVTGASMLKIALISALGLGAAGTTYVLARGDGPSAPTVDVPAASAPIDSFDGERTPARAVPRAGARGAPTRHAAGAAPAAAACDEGSCAELVEPVGPTLAADDIARLGLHAGPARGPADAPVQIALFQDVGCKFCAMVLATIDQLWDEYPGQLRLVVKQFPLPDKPVTRLGAEALLAAEAQGKFWPFHDLVLAHQDELSRGTYLALAAQAGLDVDAFTRALDDGAFAAAVDQDLAAASELGVVGTPTFYVNGVRINGAQPVDLFRAQIDAALAARGQAGR